MRVIRLISPELIAFWLAASGILDRFPAAYPPLRVEFVLSDLCVDLAKGQADVAVRTGDTACRLLVGRKFADSFWAIYASRQWVERHGAPAKIAEVGLHPLIAFEESISRHRIVLWLREVAPGVSYAARNTSVLGLIYAANAPVGLAPLPLPLGDAEPDLVRVLGPVSALTRACRILAHPDLRHKARITAFFAFILQEADALRPILTE